MREWTKGMNYIVEKERTSITTWSYLIIKRLFDIVFGILGVIALIPVSLIVFMFNVLNKDYSSVFYTHTRIGKNGKEFKLYKFRSMVPNADDLLIELLKDEKIAVEYNANKKLKNDPRITKVGKILRKSSLDELPQFINILKGDMSLVGNRPYLPREKKDMGKYYDDIIKTKPGLTGYWQVSGRSDVSFKKRLELEQYYSNNFSLGLDIKIIFKTVKVVLKMNGAE